jgi:hypothetical protein
MLRTLLAVLVVKTSGRIHPVGIELPLPSDESETIHECIRALEEDSTVAFSADMIESNDPNYSWASQGIDVPPNLHETNPSPDPDPNPNPLGLGPSQSLA